MPGALLLSPGHGVAMHRLLGSLGLAVCPFQIIEHYFFATRVNALIHQRQRRDRTQHVCSCQIGVNKRQRILPIEQDSPPPVMDGLCYHNSQRTVGGELMAPMCRLFIVRRRWEEVYQLLLAVMAHASLDSSGREAFLVQGTSLPFPLLSCSPYMVASSKAVIHFVRNASFLD